MEKHSQYLRQLFTKLQERGVTINVKCEFGKESVQSQGNMLNSQGITPVPIEIVSIRSYPLPKWWRNLQRYLGLISCHRLFILNRATMLQSLTDALRGNFRAFRLSTGDIQASVNHKRALDVGRTNMWSTTCRYDRRIEHKNVSCSVTVSKWIWELLSFSLKKINPTQTRYSTFVRKLLAIYLATKHFWHVIEGTIFSVHRS